MKPKRSLLDDFMKIYKNIHCDSFYCNCNDCSNNRLCDLLQDVIKNCFTNKCFVYTVFYIMCNYFVFIIS